MVLGNGFIESKAQDRKDECKCIKKQKCPVTEECTFFMFDQFLDCYDIKPEIYICNIIMIIVKR